MVEYLNAQDLIAINAAQDGGGVQNQEGVEANANRPQAAFGGIEAFPDLWSKAAAYIHGIASTQYFIDGNKRTAWLAANIFLEANGILLPRVLDIEAEAFVQSVAQNVWNTEAEPDLTITKAAEWLRKKAEAKPVDSPSSWDPSNDPSSMVITGVFFAEYARVSEQKLDTLGGVWDTYWMADFPQRVALTAVVICQTPGTAHVGLVRIIDGYIVRPGRDPDQILRAHLTINEGENRFVLIPVILDVTEPGRHVFQFMLEDRPSTARTLSLDFQPSVPQPLAMLA